VKFIIAMVMMLAPLAVHAQMLKCISKDGKVEYAASCPPGTKEQQTGIKSTPAAPAPAASDKAGDKGADKSKPKTFAEQEADFKKRQVEKAEAAGKKEKEDAEAAQRKRACEEARSYLAGLESGARITRNDPKTGERAFLDDSARAQEVQRAQQSVQANCK
jgi:hypothetical protein